MAEQWKSPRKVEEEITQYKRRRFEDYMSLVDEGVLEQAVAITALREELENPEAFWTPEQSKQDA